MSSPRRFVAQFDADNNQVRVYDEKGVLRDDSGAVDVWAA
jgi:hypothetical protein